MDKVTEFLAHYKRARTKQTRTHLGKFIEDNKLSSAQSTFLQGQVRIALEGKVTGELAAKAMDYHLKNEEAAMKLLKRYRRDRECYLHKWQAEHYPSTDEEFMGTSFSDFFKKLWRG